MEDMDELLTTKQAAALLGLSEQRIRQLVTRGELPSIKPGHDRLMRRGDVVALRARKTAPGPAKSNPRKQSAPDA